MSTVDVLVVGAGPVGMALALELSIQGVAFRIVDKELIRSDKSRALAVHSRTLEALNRYGGIDELLKNSQQIAGNDFWINGKQFQGFKAVVQTQEQPQTQFRGIFAISQVDTEDFLERHLARKGVTVDRLVTVQKIVQNDNASTVTLVRSDGCEETVRAKYVVGCDGAHSTVRHSMDVDFQGDSYDQEFVLADAMIDWAGFGDKVHIMLGGGMLMMLPLSRGTVRVIHSKPAELAPDDDPKLEDFQRAIDASIRTVGGPRLLNPLWLTRFHLYHRCASKYRDGRLFIAGDAAHIHSPVGGQGMNTGIQDSVNLGWKLARVLNGEEPDAFLDSYHQERWPIGQHLLSRTDQMFTFLTSNAPIFSNIRAFVLPHAFPSISGSDMGPKLMRYFSGLGVKYRRSPIVHNAVDFEGPVRGGFRAPDGQIRGLNGKQSWLLDLLTGPGYHALIFSEVAEDIEKEARTRVLGIKGAPQVHIITSAQSQNPEAIVDVDGELHRRYGFETKPGFVHVRPDGYIESIGYFE